jgi:predicted Rossmann fold flavoprotein
MPVRVAIIGGGASGMVAAIAASRAGAEVRLFEKGERVGRKLLATGNGRCNLTNIDLDPVHFHGQVPTFSRSVLARHDSDWTLRLFEDLGITPVVEERGRVFPRSGQASSVLDVLRWRMEELGVQVLCGGTVQAVERTAGAFRVVADPVPPAGPGGTADRVVLATGGRAAPGLGADGSGYLLARSLGHRILEPFPALAPLRLSSPWLRQLQGTRFDGAVEVLCRGRVVAQSQGEVLFTDHGASGPAVMDVCRAAGECLQAGDAVHLNVRLVADLEPEVLRQEVARRFEHLPHRPASAVLVGFLNKRLIPAVLRESGVTDLEQPAAGVAAAVRGRIADTLRSWSFEVIGTGPWAGAQVTAGGVDVADVDPDTLESRLVPGLFLAGEVLDVDGDCGGFNLQWAWASGHVAGENAARGR